MTTRTTIRPCFFCGAPVVRKMPLPVCETCKAEIADGRKRRECQLKLYEAKRRMAEKNPERYPNLENFLWV